MMVLPVQASPALTVSVLRPGSLSLWLAMTLLAGRIEVGPDGLRIENDSGGYLALKPGFATGASALNFA